MGNYYICIDHMGRVTRKEKLGRAPSLGRTLDGVRCRVGKKTYMECKVGQVISERVLRSLPEESVRLIRNMNTSEMESIDNG